MHSTENEEIRYQLTARRDSAFRLALTWIRVTVFQQRCADALDNAVDTVPAQDLHDRHVDTQFYL